VQDEQVCDELGRDVAGWASTGSAYMGMQRAENDPPQAFRRGPSPGHSARMRCQGARTAY